MSKITAKEIDHAADLLLDLGQPSALNDVQNKIKDLCKTFFLHGANWAICIQEQRQVRIGVEPSDIISDQNKTLDL